MVDIEPPALRQGRATLARRMHCAGIGHRLPLRMGVTVFYGDILQNRVVEQLRDQQLPEASVLIRMLRRGEASQFRGARSS